MKTSFENAVTLDKDLVLRQFPFKISNNHKQFKTHCKISYVGLHSKHLNILISFQESVSVHI